MEHLCVISNHCTKSHMSVSLLVAANQMAYLKTCRHILTYPKTRFLLVCLVAFIHGNPL